MLDPIILLIALISGLVFKAMGQPALIGYLLTGFLINALGFQQGELIHQLANIGEILLLFTIGLKLKLKDLAAPYVLGVSLLHMLVIMPFFFYVIVLTCQLLPTLPDISHQGTWLLAFSLAFSSTIFAVKIFDEKGESTSLFAVITIGILVVQDVVAVIYMSSTSHQLPSPYTLLLVLLIPLKPLIDRLLQYCGHGELLILAGFTFAFGFTEIFESLGLKADLGALLIGCYLGNSSKSKELSSSLISVKDLFLVGFFLSIGLHGLPSVSMLGFALILVAVLFVKPLLFFLLFVSMRLRARTALLSSLALANYSEFGLILVSLAVSQSVLDASWLVMIAVALSFSYLIASPFNKSAHFIYARGRNFFHRFEHDKRLAIEQPAQIGKANILILGLGRVGQGAYDQLHQTQGSSLVAVEENKAQAQIMQKKGYNVIHADGNDNDFWLHLNLQHVHLIMISLTNHAENRSVVELIQKTQFSGQIAVVVRFGDQKEELEKMGCLAFNLYDEAGHGFAEHVTGNLKSDNINC